MSLGIGEVVIFFPLRNLELCKSIQVDSEGDGHNFKLWEI